MAEEKNGLFDFLRRNERETKPRRKGITEIRGPYYSPMGPTYLEDLLKAMGEYVDSLKFAGGSFTMMPESVVRELIEIAHGHDVEVSTGGFIEYVLTNGNKAAIQYFDACRELGFDTVEISSGFVSLPIEDWLLLVNEVQARDMKAKPEIGIQFGAGGDTASGELAAEGTQDVRWAVEQAKRFLDAGVEQIMIESEGITENVKSWREDVITTLINELGLDNLMFEAADPAVFAWYIKTFGPYVNLFVDHSQIVQLEALRQGIWGTKSLWGRVVTFRPTADDSTRQYIGTVSPPSSSF